MARATKRGKCGLQAILWGGGVGGVEGRTSYFFVLIPNHRRRCTVYHRHLSATASPTGAESFTRHGSFFTAAASSSAATVRFVTGYFQTVSHYPVSPSSRAYNTRRAVRRNRSVSRPGSPRTRAARYFGGDPKSAHCLNGSAPVMDRKTYAPVVVVHPRRASAGTVARDRYGGGGGEQYHRPASRSPHANRSPPPRLQKCYKPFTDRGGQWVFRKSRARGNHLKKKKK